MTDPALLVTRDDGLRDDLLRLAAAAGVPLHPVPDPSSALRSWAATSLAFVGADVAAELADLRPPPHPELHVVGPRQVPDALYRHALTLGARQVVALPEAEAWLASLLADLADGAARTALTVGVVPGSGGAGASSLAAALAQVGSRDRDTVLLDLDRWGPGLDRVLGVDDADGVRWEALADLQGRLGSRSLRAALPGRDRLGVLTWAGVSDDPDRATVVEVVSAAGRGSDLVVADLPCDLGGPALDVAARCDLVVLVVEPTLLSVSAAAKVAGRLADTGAPGAVLVRGSRGSFDPDDVAAALALPLVATVATRGRVVELVELGMGPAGSRRSPLVRAARDVLVAAEARTRRAA
jgi:secretion/DNA translocation related CpaE-like protein